MITSATQHRSMTLQAEPLAGVNVNPTTPSFETFSQKEHNYVMNRRTHRSSLSKIVWLVLSATVLFGGHALGQTTNEDNAFSNIATLSPDSPWEDSSSSQDSDLDTLNARIGERQGNNNRSNYTFELDANGKKHFEISEADATLTFKRTTDDSAIYLDRDTLGATVSFTIRSKKDDTSIAGSANTLPIRITLNQIDEQPDVKPPFNNADSGGKQIYIQTVAGTSSQRTTNLQASEIFQDPERFAIQLKQCADDFEIDETVNGSPEPKRGLKDTDYDVNIATGSARHCAVVGSENYDATTDVRAGGKVVNITTFGPRISIQPVAGTSAGTNTAAVTLHGWVGTPVLSGVSHDEIVKTPPATFTVHVRTGVNNTPDWRGVTGFRADIKETAAEVKIGPTTAGAWNATDLDTDDTITYSLDGQPASSKCTDAEGMRYEDAVAVGAGCVWLVLQGENVEIWGKNFDSETGSPSYTIRLVAMDNYPGGTASIPIIINIENVDEPVAAPEENIPELNSLVVGLGSRSVDLNKYFSDPEGKDITYTVQTSQDGVLSASLVGSRLTLTAIKAGTTIVYIQASAADSTASTSFNQSVSVRADNDPPVFTGNPLQVAVGPVNENTVSTEPLTGTLRYSDPDGDTVSVEIIGNVPFSAIVDPEIAGIKRNGEIGFRVTGTVDFETQSTYEFQVRLNDGWETGTQLVTVLVSVNDLDEAPHPVSGLTIPTQTVAVNGSGSIDIAPYYRDPEGGNITVSNTTANPIGFATIAVQSGTVITYTGTQVTTVNQPVVVSFDVLDNRLNRTRGRFSLVVSPNAPPTKVRDIAPQSLGINDTLDVELSGTYTDPDAGDSVSSYSATTSNDQVVLARVPSGRTYVTLIGRGEGTATVTITASDTRGGSSSTLSFVVTVIGNKPPVVAVTPSNQEMVRGDTHTLNLSTTFTDPDEDDTITYAATSSNADVATAIVSGSTLSVEAVGVGRATIRVTASDSEDESVSTQFSVMVDNIPPKVVGMIADQTTNRLEDVTVDISSVFADDDGDSLAYMVSVANSAVASATVSGTEIQIEPNGLGTTEITVTAMDEFNGKAEVSFNLTVENLAPEVAATIPAVSLQIGGDAAERDLTDTFTDDGDALTLSFEVDDTSVASVSMTGMALTISGVSAGTATLTVTATDPHDASISTTASITVSDSEIKGVGVNTLASFGRAVLAGVSSSVGGRLLSDSDINYSTFALADPSEQSPDSTNALVDSGYTTTNLSALNSWGTSTNASNQSNSMAGYSTQDTLHMLIGERFFMNLGAVGDPTYYSIWGGFSTNSFEGAAYEGDAGGFYVGADLTLNGQWTFGLAVGSNSGEADYSFGTAERTMENSLTTILPYLRITPSDRTTIYGVLGFGSGEMETTTGGGAAEVADLSSSIGLFGGKQIMFAGGTGMTVAIVGDFGFANLETDEDAANASGGIAADASRIRGGVEGSMNLAMGVDGSMVPYLNVSFRSDGGDGETGSGVEIASGLRVAQPGFAIDAQFRTLASSGVDDYSETGFSATATVNPGQTATGFSMSVTPRWGADSHGTDLLWNDSMQMNSLDQYVMSDAFSAEETFMVSSKMSYGLTVLNDQFRLKPYLNVNSRKERPSSVLLGTELVRLTNQNNRQLSLGVEMGKQSAFGNLSQETAKVQTRLTF